MSALSRGAAAQSAEISRNDIRDTETDFGEAFGEIVKTLYPPPNTAAQLAAEIPCSVRLVEMYFEGRQPWSDTAVAFIVGEILRRKRMRNVKVKARQ